LLPLRRALRAATPFPIDAVTIEECLDDERDPVDALFRRARAVGLAGLTPGERSGHLWRVVGEVAESMAEVVLTKLAYNVFWTSLNLAFTASTCCFSRLTRLSSHSRSRARYELVRYRA
jgi:hypothetical protein